MKVDVYTINCNAGVIRCLIVMALYLATGPSVEAQITVLHTQLHPMNATPSSSLEASLMNQGGAAMVRLESRIFNSNGQVVMQAASGPTALRAGVNMIRASQLTITNTFYGANAAGTYSKTHSRLPSGLYTHCLTVVPLDATETGDEHCQDIDAGQYHLFQAMFPYNKDNVESNHPVFVWMYDQPFNSLDPGISFQFILVELQPDQSPDAGLALNTPLFLKADLQKHQVSYPPSAPRLRAGNRYAWRIEKLSEGTVIDQTDASEFEVSLPQQQKGSHVAVLKRELDASFYEVTNDLLSFGFDEKYHKGEVTCRIYDERQQEILPVLQNTEKKDRPNVISGGYNHFELDLSTYALKSGFYYLEVWNQKAEKFRLRFYVT